MVSPADTTATNPQDSRDTTGTARLGPVRLLRMAGFRRLLLSRFAAQWGDGLFQVGLAGAVLFNPERAADPAAIAAGFTVLLLPYSVVGPFAGALLDRWDRRRVLLGANLLRGLLILITAVVGGAGLPSLDLYIGALIAVGVSRFVNSGLSASLPHVVEPANLVEANAVATTLGAVVSVIGAGCAVLLRAVFGSGDLGSAEVTAVAVLGSIGGAWAAARFRPGALGPDEVDGPAETMVAVARGLLDGWRAAMAAPSVAAGFAALLAHRAAYGASLLITVLLLRYSFHSEGVLQAGLGGLGEVAFVGGLGLLLAGLLTTRLVGRFGRRAAVCGALVLAAASQAGLGLPMTLPTIIIAAFLLTAAGQVIKLCVDSAVQRDIGDETRGRVFAVYDTLFNTTQVVAIALAAWVVPLDGRSTLVILVATALYLAGLGGYLLVLRRRGDGPAEPAPAA